MLPRINKDWPNENLDYESTASSDVISILQNLGHKTEPSKTMGSTQSIHIKNGFNYGYSDLRRHNAGVAIQVLKLLNGSAVNGGPAAHRVLKQRIPQYASHTSRLPSPR